MTQAAFKCACAFCHRHKALVHRDDALCLKTEGIFLAKFLKYIEFKKETPTTQKLKASIKIL